MYPFVSIFGKTFTTRDVLINIGTVLGLVLMFLMLYKYGTKNKRDYAAYVLSLILSYPFGRVLRGIIEADSISELLTTGTHFLGIVFAFYFIFPIVYRLICKKAPTEEIKGFSAVYFSIQHFFSRLGCYSLGCCFGVYYTGIFSITFPVGTNPYRIYGEALPTFPSQLFEAVCAFCLFVLSAVLICKRKKTYTYSIFIILFCISIFISEIYMYKYPFERTIFQFSYVQICCAILILAETGRLIIKRRLKTK